MEGHPLARMLCDIAAGHFPDFSSTTLRVVPATSGGLSGVFGFTGGTVISCDLASEDIQAALPGDDPGAAMTPTFLSWLAERLASRSYTPDLAMMATQTDAGEPLVERPDHLDHPRAQLAQSYSGEVTCFSTVAGEGLVTLGYGVCGRHETSVEIDVTNRGHGLGRKLALAIRAHLPPGEVVWASISPGNTASIRAFLAAGYTPVGSEMLMLPGSLGETPPT